MGALGTGNTFTSLWPSPLGEPSPRRFAHATVPNHSHFTIFLMVKTCNGKVSIKLIVHKSSKIFCALHTPSTKSTVTKTNYVPAPNLITCQPIAQPNPPSCRRIRSTSLFKPFSLICRFIYCNRWDALLLLVHISLVNHAPQRGSPQPFHHAPSA